MPATHTIRLRDHWRVEPTDSGGHRYRRRFGWTAVLGTEEQLCLVIGEAATGGRVWLNDTPLGTFGPGALPARFDISSRVQPRNEVTIEVGSGPVAAVRLEVHENSRPISGDTS
jgi:hypothetical protein